MTETEWLACSEPDMMLEELEGKVSPERLVEFVRRCWQRITPYLPREQKGPTVVDEFAALAGQQSDHDAMLYAYEAILKADRWAPSLKEEQAQQAMIVRQMFEHSPCEAERDA